MVLAALAGAMILAAAALAAATPVAPPPGATVTTSHPHFSWTLPANEQAQSIYIARKPDVTPEGRFYDQSIVALGVLAPGDREWTPTSPLYAGRYWWNLWSSNQDSFALFSVPAAFTIPVSLRLLGAKLKRYPTPHVLEMKVRWSANVERPVIRLRLLRGQKIVWKASQTDTNVIGVPGSTDFSWKRPKRIKQGARLTLLASISSRGAKRTRALIVRAP
jgi:hypothetical protein